MVIEMRAENGQVLLIAKDIDLIARNKKKDRIRVVVSAVK